LGAVCWRQGAPKLSANPSPTLIVAQGSGLDRVSYATNWYAQAEHGGFYQAVATGIYREHGLDVTIKMGGPGINITQVLAGGAAEFAMGGSTGVINAVREGIPLVCVAAIFQKDPQIIMAHPGTQRFEELKGPAHFRLERGGLPPTGPT
jgi:NitT/TauT family transport system substrate-binding protein